MAEEAKVAETETEIATPQHAARRRAAREKKERRQATVTGQWIELVKRVSNEDPKVNKRTTTSSGMTHSVYVGRFSKSLVWLKQQEKAGVEIFDGPKKDGRKFKFPDKK